MGRRIAGWSLLLIVTIKSHSTAQIDAPQKLPEASLADVRALAAQTYNRTDLRYINVVTALKQLIQDMEAGYAVGDLAATQRAGTRQSTRSLQTADGCPACVCTPTPPPPPALPADWTSPPEMPPPAEPVPGDPLPADQGRQAMARLILWSGVVGSVLVPFIIVFFVTYCCAK